MVDKKRIDDIFNSIISNTVSKCLTLARIKEKLSAFTLEEKRSMLEGRLTPLEWEDYNKQQDYYYTQLKEYEGWLTDGTVDEEKLPYLHEVINNLKGYWSEAVFKYERRILENTYIQDYSVPQIDTSSYVHDESIPINPDIWENYMGRSRIQPIEMEQINLQDTNVYFTEKEGKWLSGYFLSDYFYINSRLFGMKEGFGDYMDVGEREYMDKEFNNLKRHLDNAISKTDGLVHDTILYHSGKVDLSDVPGKHGVWKAYTSASFQEDSAKSAKQDGDWDIIIYAPNGTKGVCGNGQRYFENRPLDYLNQYTFEHEYLLGRNTGYTVLEMDYVNHRQVVVLDG